MKKIALLVMTLTGLNVFGQIKLDQNNKIGLRTLTPSHEIESWGVWIKYRSLDLRQCGPVRNA